MVDRLVSVGRLVSSMLCSGFSKRLVFVTNPPARYGGYIRKLVPLLFRYIF